MKKVLIALLAACAALTLAGCGSTAGVAQAPSPAQAAPDWVLNQAKPSDATYWYAVGTAKMPTEQNSLKMARMQARAELARTVNTQVSDAVTAKSRMANDGTDVKSLERVVHFSAEALLVGSEQVGRFTSPNGTVYVLMALPKASALEKLNAEAAAATGKAGVFSAGDLQ